MSGGDQLSFPVFRANIVKLPDYETTVLECAIFLRITGTIKGKKSWKKFSASFFEYYQPVILGFFGYQPDILDIPLVKVNNKPLFMATMVAMQKNGMFGCAATELAIMIFLTFDLGLELSSIQQGLYDDLLEYENVLELFKTYSITLFKK